MTPFRSQKLATFGWRASSVDTSGAMPGEVAHRLGQRERSHRVSPTTSPAVARKRECWARAQRAYRQRQREGEAVALVRT
jgi:hypothetical protein